VRGWTKSSCRLWAPDQLVIIQWEPTTNHRHFKNCWWL